MGLPSSAQPPTMECRALTLAMACWEYCSSHHLCPGLWGRVPHQEREVKKNLRLLPPHSEHSAPRAEVSVREKLAVVPTPILHFPCPGSEYSQGLKQVIKIYLVPNLISKDLSSLQQRVKNFKPKGALKNRGGGFPGGTVVESLPANAGDTGLSPGLGRSHMPRSN